MATSLGKIVWFRGDSYPITLTIKDKSTKNPIDINGYFFRMTVNKVQNPSDTSEQVFTIDGVIDNDPTTGIVLFTPSSTDTDHIPGNYYYDIEMTDNSSNIRTIIKDKFNITQDISK